MFWGVLGRFWFFSLSMLLVPSKTSGGGFSPLCLAIGFCKVHAGALWNIDEDIESEPSSDEEAEVEWAQWVNEASDSSAASGSDEEANEPAAAAAAAEPVLVAVPVPAEPPPHNILHAQPPQPVVEVGPVNAGLRARHDESGLWGRFYITRVRGKRSWQAICKYHGGPMSRCTKSIAWRGDDDTEKAQALKRLKYWCVQARHFQSKEAHQGPRGLPPPSQELMHMSAADLDRLEAALPAPAQD